MNKFWRKTNVVEETVIERFLLKFISIDKEEKKSNLIFTHRYFRVSYASSIKQKENEQSTHVFHSNTFLIEFFLEKMKKKAVENVAAFGRDQLSLVGTVLSVFSSAFSSSSLLRKWKSKTHTQNFFLTLRTLSNKTEKFSSEIKLNYHMSLFSKRTSAFLSSRRIEVDRFFF